MGERIRRLNAKQVDYLQSFLHLRSQRGIFWRAMPTASFMRSGIL